MKKNLQSELKGWLKHWYLGGGTTENRAMLDEETRKIEPKAYKLILSILNDEKIISRNANPLT